MSHTPRRLRPRRQPKGIPVIFRSKTRPVITEQEARGIQRHRNHHAGRCVMTDEDYLRAVLNCDDQSGMATDAAWRAVSALRARAERAEAEVQRLHRVIAESLPYIDFSEQFAQAEAAIQRVQAVCDKPNPGPSWDSYVEGYNDAISVVQAAMEGEVDA